MLFLVEHFLANVLLLCSNPIYYQSYEQWITSLYGVRFLEYSLLAVFAVHIGNGVLLKLYQQRLKKKMQRTSRSSKPSTQFVGRTGLIILLFLVVHLAQFFVPGRLDSAHQPDMYTEARIVFSSVWYVLFYLVCMAALAMHLHHGIRSAFFSFRWVPARYVTRIRSVISFLGVVATVGLAYIALHLYIVSVLDAS